MKGEGGRKERRKGWEGGKVNEKYFPEVPDKMSG